jgi:hypothetical protein
LRVAKVSATSVPASSEGVVEFVLRGCLLRSGKGVAGPHQFALLRCLLRSGDV